MNKIEEAQQILYDLGLPKQQQNKLSALTLHLIPTLLTPSIREVARPVGLAQRPIVRIGA